MPANLSAEVWPHDTPALLRCNKNQASVFLPKARGKLFAMDFHGIPEVDLLGTLFLIFALLALLWSMHRRQFNVGDEEASRVLWTADDSPEITSSEEVHRRPESRGLMIALFVVVISLMALAPIVTILTAKHAAQHAASNYAYPSP